ncbi:hypothetical protein LTR36_000963 [Oleoguttula mirabilis]|uniref:Uncharacterized protein n=1 Tax=Oleoguttula mirabilis TaxID=1507867 RepID=A0AAV9JPK1_9PEZI|nr:hypothetical protein LTR36_000963 [Oleoguttula mirabilis]
MSWMDSWKRPNKSQAVPPPFYLTQGDSALYCHTCGRIIGQRRANTSKAAATEVKYCSDKCKRHKPSNAPDSLDRRIDDVLTALLQGQPPPVDGNGNADAGAPAKALHKPKKGDPRIIVKLSELETAVFGDRQDPEKVYGRRKNRKARFLPESGEWRSVDMEDRSTTTAADDAESEDDGSLTDGSIEETPGGVSLTHVRAPQSQSEINFSAGGGERGWAEKIEETPEMLAKRREGQKRADEKEMVKRSARRAVAFGLTVDAQPEKSAGKRTKKGQGAEMEAPERVKRKCEALMGGSVVEPSFAKGDWSIRWRED